MRRRGILGLATLAAAGGCSAPPPLLRIGAHAWPGYQPMFLVEELGLMPPGRLRMVEMPTASASLRALAAGTLDGAGLTLDEVLSARARGLMLRAVAVLDVSNGADVLLGRPGLDTLAALRGQRVGVEQTATGALMLDAALGQAGLRPSDVRQVPLAFTEHAQALRGHQVDAVVTFEPVRSQLLAEGARLLFSSTEVPGLIVDVLAVRPDLQAGQAATLRALVAGSLQASAALQRDPAALATRLAPRLRLSPAAVREAFGQLELPDLAANRRWLAGPAPALQASAARLMTVMQRAALLSADARPLADGGDGGDGGDDSDAGAGHRLADPGFLPGD
jgi:NitT/TauT family transport system substrate-binding protein